MHASLGGVHIIGKGEYNLVVAVVILEGHLRDGVPLLAGHIDDILVEGRLIAVDVGDKLPDTALIAHIVVLLLSRALVNGVDAQAGVQKGLLPHTGVEDIIVVHRGVGEHLWVGLKGDGGAVLVGISHHGDGLGHLAPGKLHLINFSVLMDLDLQPLAEGVDHAGAHAVETAGDLIAPAAEFAAGMQDGEDHLQGGKAGLRLYVHGYAAPVVRYGDDVALSDDDVNLVAVPGQRLVDGVVHDLVHQVVETGGGGGADVHTGALAHRLQALQDLNLAAAVLMLHLGAVLFQF